MHNKYLLLAISVCLSINYSFSQSTEYESNDDKSVPFYKWEIGINPITLIDKSIDPFGFIVKRNFTSRSGRQALRLKTLPRFSSSPLVGGSSETQVALNLGVGYEWQKLYTHFALHYGVDASYQNSIHKIKTTQKGIIFEQTNNVWELSPFIAGRYYINNHVALTLETHLSYKYNDSHGEDTTSKSFHKNHSITVLPLQAFYLSYHF